MKKLTVLFACLFVISLTEPAAAVVYIDDGESHLVNDDTYQHVRVCLDFYTENDPGTHLKLVDGGIIDAIVTYNNSTVEISGGSIGDCIIAYSNSIVTITSGSIAEELFASHGGTIYIYGSDFSVGGQDLNYGDSLRDYGTEERSIYPPYYYYFVGTITGSLLDGSPLNNEFMIHVGSDSDIIVIPEPATILLLGLGGLALMRNRRFR